jgi:biopolymer transport protein ExbD
MQHQEVEMQVTPMLDMAFQLLTFFILTYHPAPVEGQFTMNLLPAAPAIDMDASAPATGEQAATDVPAALKTLTTNILSSSDGTIGRIVLGESEFENLGQLKARLKQIVSDKTLLFDQAVIRVDPMLSYAELMKVIDVFAGPEVNITKLSFAELTDTGEVSL